MIHFEHITTSAAIERFLPQWRALWERIPDATPFQSPAWLWPWWEQFGKGDGGSGYGVSR